MVVLPIAGWIIENETNAGRKWMRTGGTPISGNLYVYLILSTPMPCNLIRIISNLWICSYGHTNTSVWAAGSRNENYQGKIIKGSSCHAQLGHAVGDVEGFKPSRRQPRPTRKIHPNPNPKIHKNPRILGIFIYLRAPMGISLGWSYHWVGLRDNLQETPIFNGKNHGFL